MNILTAILGDFGRFGGFWAIFGDFRRFRKKLKFGQNKITLFFPRLPKKTPMFSKFISQKVAFLCNNLGDGGGGRSLVEIRIGSNPLMSIMDAPLDFNWEKTLWTVIKST